MIIKTEEEFRRPLTINPEIEEIINSIINLLTEDQLRTLEFSYRGERYGFKDRMILAYRKMRPAFGVEKIRELAMVEIENYKDLFEVGIAEDMNEAFIRKLNYFFVGNAKFLKEFDEDFS